MAITKLQMNLFTSLFKGREEVFAKRWETKDKSGYAPAYDIDWNQYSLHKASGGTLKDYPHKSYSKLTDAAIKAHLEGKEVVGITLFLKSLIYTMEKAEQLLSLIRYLLISRLYEQVLKIFIV